MNFLRWSFYGSAVVMLACIPFAGWAGLVFALLFGVAGAACGGVYDRRVEDAQRDARIRAGEEHPRP